MRGKDLKHFPDFSTRDEMKTSFLTHLLNLKFPDVDYAIGGRSRGSKLNTVLSIREALLYLRGLFSLPKIF